MKNGNIILIGMPSSGKSTVGKQLALALGMDFIDTDTVITENENKTPKDIVVSYGLETFFKIQESAVTSLNVKNHVIATGGSVVCSSKSMEHLKKDGIVVYLETEFDQIENRLAPGRRFARAEGQSLSDMYQERKVLYEKYADLIVNCTDKQPEDIVNELKLKL